ncbi:Uncharacterised protein [Vibrio cholerae]|nr:Uncharacterised protein [Vibrio cholerae]
MTHNIHHLVERHAAAIWPCLGERLKHIRNRNDP